MDLSMEKDSDNEIIITKEISEHDSRIPALQHIVGNEYEMNWKTVWIHGKTGSVRIAEGSHGITVHFHVVQP